jgi:hypothetical protein
MTKPDALARATNHYLGRYKTKDGANIVPTEAIVDYACKLMLKDAGADIGVEVQVIRGRHKGLQGPITDIRWSEAEVKIGECNRWFGLWHRPEFVVI